MSKVLQKYPAYLRGIPVPLQIARDECASQYLTPEIRAPVGYEQGLGQVTTEIHEYTRVSWYNSASQKLSQTRSERPPWLLKAPASVPSKDNLIMS